MDFSGKLILAFLEEDNTQRSLFHVRPLLSESGPVPQSDIDAYADTGFIRVVPDKNEQYTFKERMRTLGDMCIINLRDFPEDANKIRPNRNYQPKRGELHQFIVYSNAIQPLPEDLVFEVVAGKPDSPVAACYTPCCYLREGGRIEGPYYTRDGSVCGALSALRPDSTRLYSISLPTGQERLFYWPVVQELPKEEPSAKELIRMMDEELPALGNTIKEDTAFRLPEPTPVASKLTGTPIFRVAAKRTAPKRAHNPLNAMVDRCTREHQLEAPGATMDDPSCLQKVDSPVDAFKRALDTLWHAEDAQRQAVEYLLSQPAATAIVSRAMTQGDDNTIVSAMNQQLEDLEAERLSLLMQLDKAKESKEAFAKEALETLGKAAQKQLKDTEQAIAAAHQTLENIQRQQQALLEERNTLIADIEKLGNQDRILAPVQGTQLDLMDTLRRMQSHLQHAGFDAQLDDTRHLLLLLLLCPQVQVHTAALPDSILLSEALAHALGAEMVSALEEERIIHLPGGDGPAFALCSRGARSAAPFTRLIMSAYARPQGKAYAYAPWPCACLTSGKVLGEKLPGKEGAVSMRALSESVEKLRLEDLPADAVQLIKDVQQSFKKQGSPLPFRVMGEVHTYLKRAAGMMDGGIAAALDYALAAFVVPHALYYQLDMGVLEKLLPNLPRTARLL